MGGESINVIWQPKYIGTRREAWLLSEKLKKYQEKGGNQTVYITFEKDDRYGLSGRVFRVKGGHLHIELQCELFYHEETCCSYYCVPLDDLVEVTGIKLPCDFIRRVEEHRRLKEEENEATNGSSGEARSTKGSYPTKGENDAGTKAGSLEEEIASIEAEEQLSMDDYGLEELDDFEEEEQVDEEQE